MAVVRVCCYLPLKLFTPSSLGSTWSSRLLETVTVYGMCSHSWGLPGLLDVSWILSFDFVTSCTPINLHLFIHLRAEQQLFYIFGWYRATFAFIWSWSTKNIDYRTLSFVSVEVQWTLHTRLSKQTGFMFVLVTRWNPVITFFFPPNSLIRDCIPQFIWPDHDQCGWVSALL